MKVYRGARKRIDLRNRLWPRSDDQVWNGADEKGYFCAPRSLPLILRLLHDKKIVGPLDCGRVYLELLARDFGQGIVETTREPEHAYFAGYDGRRGVRSWRERVRALESAGFISTKGTSHAEFGYVLIRHPYLVVSGLRERGLVDEGWWQDYSQLLTDTGATAPTPRKRLLQVVPGVKRLPAQPQARRRRAAATPSGS